jgi:RNA polymerase sigma-B factor
MSRMASAASAKTRRDELIVGHVGLAQSLALRFSGPRESTDDLVQVAYLGLVKAAERFDPTRGFAFSSFAVPTILGELRRHFRDSTWDIRPRRDVQELGLAVERAHDELCTELGRSPTARDVAERVGRSVEDVLEARGTAQLRSSVSLDAPAVRDAEDAPTVADQVGREDPGYARIELASEIDSLGRQLDRRAREILRLRYEEDLLQSEIAERVGCSQMHVSRTIRSSLEKLRTAA